MWRRHDSAAMMRRSSGRAVLERRQPLELRASKLGPETVVLVRSLGSLGRGATSV